MKIAAAAVRKCLKSFDFATLFREQLGWDNHQAHLDVPINGKTFRLTAVAQKRGFAAYVCSTIPDRAIRLKIDQQVTKSAREHFVIYADESAGQQVWQWVRRESGKPLASRDHRFDCSQSGDPLIQRLEQIAVAMQEEDELTLFDVTSKAKSAFDVDKVTKKFYERFKAEHTAFMKFIKGIQTTADRQWYASLMLNRLMFVYFIQKKGFLDGDTDYLRHRMSLVREAQGNDQFQSFYRYFLLRLFHDGLGKSPEERQLDRELEKLLGKIPYLNGGFFEAHQLEQRNAEIDIPDEAFTKLFDFFEDFRWHLDERPLRADNEINPDVVGYIFEKYINQKQMGAYYTKEDITEYISKNTIIPFLFDAAEKECPIAFTPRSFLWRLLSDDPDRYIYAAVRQGVIDDAGNVLPLPKEIESGVSDVAKREGWNKAAGEPFALPTETWREHVARRTRCLELREKLRAGEVHAINDLITLNLDIWQFARDAIVNSEGPELLRAFWQAIEKVTVLDPTCGSGAFLFAALRILETLYSDCLERMDRFVEDLSGKNHHPEHFHDFKAVLAQIAKHPSDRYFILKSVIVNNLFGVDLMEEAVEICKLRLFLKLVAQVDTVQQLEPLPDIDFNIRAGNTLVGFTSLEEIRKSQEGKLAFSTAEIARIEVQAAAVDRQFQLFRSLQTRSVDRAESSAEIAAAKCTLRKIQSELARQLDIYLAGEYGIDATVEKNAGKFANWQSTHAPFHWFVDFFGVMRRGGFDVVLGNPPWKEYAAVRTDYTVRDYATLPCGNLHGICTERGLRLRSPTGMLSFIVQLPLASSSRMVTVRDALRGSSESVFALMFDDRPGKLFEGLQHCRSIIFVSRQRTGAHPCDLEVTRYQRWATAVREQLFQTTRFTRVEGPQFNADQFPKYPESAAQSCFQKILRVSDETVGSFISATPTAHFVFYQEATGYWVKAVLGYPYYAKDGVVGPPAHGRHLYLRRASDSASVCAVLNSSLFYLYFIAFGDCFHLNHSLTCAFPFPSSLGDERRLGQLGKRLMTDLKKNAERMTIRTRDGHQIAYDEFYASRSKPIIDDIDAVLAEHFDFSAEDLDMIVNFDAKFRLGSEEVHDD